MEDNSKQKGGEKKRRREKERFSQISGEEQYSNILQKYELIWRLEIFNITLYKIYTLLIKKVNKKSIKTQAMFYQSIYAITFNIITHDTRKILEI